MNLTDITVLILTYNEEPNLARCLDGVAWAQKVIVLDSLSGDGTRDLARSRPRVEVRERAFDDHTSQWNFGVDAVATEWVLALDADYVVPESFPDELRRLEPGPETAAYFARFQYRVFGRPLRGTLYPPRAILFRKSLCRYRRDGHTQLLEIRGASGRVDSIIGHDDRKPLSRWFASQDSYARLEAEKLSQAGGAALPLQDRLRLWLIPAPLLTLVYCLFRRGLILDGWHGWFYTWQRVVAEIMLSLRLLERKLSKP